MNKKYYVVGSGIVGCVVARELAEAGAKVTVFERRNHTGGNVYDYKDGHGSQEPLKPVCPVSSTFLPP